MLEVSRLHRKQLLKSLSAWRFPIPRPNQFRPQDQHRSQIHRTDQVFAATLWLEATIHYSNAAWVMRDSKLWAKFYLQNWRRDLWAIEKSNVTKSSTITHNHKTLFREPCFNFADLEKRKSILLKFSLACNSVGTIGANDCMIVELNFLIGSTGFTIGANRQQRCTEFSANW